MTWGPFKKRVTTPPPLPNPVSHWPPDLPLRLRPLSPHELRKMANDSYDWGNWIRADGAEAMMRAIRFLAITLADHGAALADRANDPDRIRSGLFPDPMLGVRDAESPMTATEVILNREHPGSKTPLESQGGPPHSFCEQCVSDRYEFYNGFPPHIRGSDTSWMAAASQLPVAKTKREEVYLHIWKCGDQGATDAETSEETGMFRLTVGARRRELVLADRIEDSGRRRLTGLGSPAVVWVVKPAQGELL